jgi:hypothetical protein
MGLSSREVAEARFASGKNCLLFLVQVSFGGRGARSPRLPFLFCRKRTKPLPAIVEQNNFLG